jgi:hypothetical protein
MEGNNFGGQSHETFAHLPILSVGWRNCQGKSRTTGMIDKISNGGFAYHWDMIRPLA